MIFGVVLFINEDLTYLIGHIMVFKTEMGDMSVELIKAIGCVVPHELEL